MNNNTNAEPESNSFSDRLRADILKNEAKAKEPFRKIIQQIEAENKNDETKEIEHQEVFNRLLEKVQPLNFKQIAGLQEDEKIQQKHLLVIIVEKVIELATINNFGICRNGSFTYIYNGFYWQPVTEIELSNFLGNAAELMGCNVYESRLYAFQERLYKQFYSAAGLYTAKATNKVLINFKNGTFEITPNKQEIREFRREDFLTYQLPFEYCPTANAPLFNQFLNEVLPDNNSQNILAEYLGYCFLKNSFLKLEKVLLLYGSGANGKSVIYEIVNNLFGGTQNVSSFSLQDLTNENGYYRAMIVNKLLNFASEISGKLESSTFKQLASGEPITVRLPYGEPSTATDYARMMFNVNILPTDTEQTHAFFRRFLIIGFDVTIPPEKQDKQLAQKIINSELSGVFNWVLMGLHRLITQKNFTHSELADKQINNYKLQSDSVKMFLKDEEFEKSQNEYREFKELYSLYKTYCNDSGYRACSKRTFGDRLRNITFEIEKKNIGLIIYVQKMAFV